MSDGDSLHERDPKLHNLLLETTASVNKIVDVLGRLSQDVAVYARSSYDTKIEVENKANWLVSEQRMHRVEIDAKIKENHERVEKIADECRDLVSECRDLYTKIAVATALTSKAADGAEEAADDAKDAANAALAHTGHTGPFHLLDAHGRPTHTPEIGGRAEKDTPEDQPGVTVGVVREGRKLASVWSKMGARSQILLIVLALVALAGLMFKGGMFAHEKLNPKEETPMPAPTPRVEHREPRLELPREHRRETP